jgi:hypothetical protein
MNSQNLRQPTRNTEIQRPQIISDIRKCTQPLSVLKTQTTPVTYRPKISSTVQKTPTQGRFNVVRKSQISGKKSSIVKMNDYAAHRALVNPLNQTLIVSSSSLGS